jgi:hypothetical protein
MRKLLFITALILFAGFANLNAQDENGAQLWFCIAETVKPDMQEQYLELSQELINLCKEEDFPFAFFTWSYAPMEFELWSPLESLNDIDKMEKEWDKIMKKWGEDKQDAFNATKIKNYSKTCKVRWDLTYTPDNPDFDPDNLTYGRWIEVYLKPGTQKKFAESVQWMNEKRKANDYGVQCGFAELGLGYETPSYLVMYGHESQVKYLEYENNLDEAYQDEYQKYLTGIRKLFSKPVTIYDIWLLPELSYNPNKE